jgi:hypothetical protein
MTLAQGFTEVAAIRRSFRKTKNRWPSASEISELHSQRQERPDLLEHVTWLLKYSAPVALLGDGTPFSFASRTLAGRRQQFNLHLDRLFLQATLDAIRTESPELVGVRIRFEHEHSLVLHSKDEPPTDSELGKQFEDRSLRRRYLEAIAIELGDNVAQGFMQRAARERVSVMVNAWRNAPIQGGVADIMLASYADLHRRLQRFPSAVPVQTVHDSVVIECDRADAPQLVKEVREALELASLRFCPDVVPKADVDIRTSLAEADIIVS